MHMLMYVTMHGRVAKAWAHAMIYGARRVWKRASRDEWKWESGVLLD